MPETADGIVGTGNVPDGDAQTLEGSQTRTVYP